MPEDKYTRCPGCKTIFRVTDQQLAVRGGQVRCGHCKNVFDGHAERISLAPKAVPDQPFHDEALLGPPTVTLRDARALEPLPAAARGGGGGGGGGAADAAVAAADVSPSPPARADELLPEPPDTAAAPPGPAERESDEALPAAADALPALDYANRFARPRGGRLPGALDRWAVFALPLLLLALIAQAAFHFRDALAAHVPAAKPLLVRACALLGCSVGPLQESSGLSIDASDLQADPAHRGLLTLTATLRNRAGWPLAYPHLELTLTDAQDQVVVRRALAPAEYVGAGADLAAGIAANAEVPVKLFIDASATTQAGYRLYAFYP
ncbi:MAG: DUF3426 domain-containing protein [Betaproteobacteria bacterium]|nr:DUF3426 domain-containing protein [Betaproteobacteria bacterium]